MFPVKSAAFMNMPVHTQRHPIIPHPKWMGAAPVRTASCHL